MNWFDPFCEMVTCSESVASQAEPQLRRQFGERTRLKIDRYVLVPPEAESDTYFDDDGAFCVDTELVAPDAESFPVSLAWRCIGRARARPADPGPGEVIEAWWRSLPVEELRARYAGTSGPPWPTSADFPYDGGRYSFAVAWEPFAWPDLWLEIHSDRPVFPECSDMLVDTLQAVSERWNQAAEGGAETGVIHVLGTLCQVAGPQSLLVNVDFGSASPRALVAMLDTLQQLAGELGICRVVVGPPGGPDQ